MNPLLQVKTQGQQVWLDNLSRTLLNEGHLARFIAEDGLSGITTNPAIFHKAIADGQHYAEELAHLRSTELSAEERYEQLVIQDVQRACDLLLPTWIESRGSSGFVSLEVSPALAHDAEGTLAAGERLAAAVGRMNLLIKVPATAAGLQAIENLVARGISVNVTLMFSLEHVEDVAAAYESGVRALIASGGDPSRVFSVASLFLSRVDTHVDALLDELGGDALALRGRTAVALAKLAYQRYRERFHGAGFADVQALGGRPQHMLWASTSTKNPAYPDLLYVEPLVGPETINTLPDATFAALRDHGRIAATATLEDGLEEAEAQFAALAALDINLNAVGETLQQNGLKQFDEAFAQLLKLTA